MKLELSMRSPWLTALMLASTFVLAACSESTAPEQIVAETDDDESTAPAADPNEPEIIVTEGGQEMVLIPGGTFHMGSEDGAPDEQPVHEVVIEPFLMDRTEVTQALFEEHMDFNPSRFRGDDLPAEQVSWPAAALFCNARSRAEGLEPVYNEDTGEADFTKNGYRLPTEAEWEYAARAGGQGDYFFGSDPRMLGQYAWFADNSAEKTHPVGTRRASPWGLHDIYGNVGEWTNDFYVADYYAGAPRENPRGPEDPGTEKFVLRGGAYNADAEALRAAARSGEFAGQFDGCIGGDHLGFRCVRNAPTEANNATASNQDQTGGAADGAS